MFWILQAVVLASSFLFIALAVTGHHGPFSVFATLLSVVNALIWRRRLWHYIVRPQEEFRS